MTPIRRFHIRNEKSCEKTAIDPGTGNTLCNGPWGNYVAFTKLFWYSA